MTGARLVCTAALRCGLASLAMLVMLVGMPSPAHGAAPRVKLLRGENLWRLDNGLVEVAIDVKQPRIVELRPLRQAQGKLCGGPNLFYVNRGHSAAALWEDAQRRADEELSRWPYSWWTQRPGTPGE
jgi:hypothetical protein